MLEWQLVPDPDWILIQNLQNRIESGLKEIRVRTPLVLKKHSSLRQSNLQLQNEAAQMSRRIRAVEHRYTAGLDGA